MRQKLRFGALHPAAPAPAYPPHGSLRAYAPPVFDQGETSSCTGHATATLVYVAVALELSKSGEAPAFVPSPRGIYADARCEEQPGEGALVDEGASIGDVITAIAHEGVRPMTEKAPDGRWSDVTPDNVGLRPTLAEDLESTLHVVLGPEHLDPTAEDFEDHVCASIGVLEVGVDMGIHANHAFMYWRAADPPVDDTSGFSETDGHDVACLDYATLSDGSKVYWLLSSWSEDFGEHGGAWVTGRWLRQACLEAWRFRAKVGPAGTKMGAAAPVHHGHGGGDGCT